MATSNNWESFNKLSKLDILAATTKMYGNSRNNIELYITVDILDINNKELIVDESVLKQHLYLCDYVTGKKIGSPWNVSDDSNEYTIRFVSAPPLSNNLTYVNKYIYSTLNASRNSKFSVGIDIPGIGAFDTSRDGTSTPNCPKGVKGSVFKAPKLIEIEALRPIDYGLPENITLDSEAFEVISSNLSYVSRLSSLGPYKEHYDGICKRRFVHIRPNKNATGEEKFQKSEITYEPIRNGDVSTGTIHWDTSNDRLCFFILVKDNPCAVIGGKSFDLNVWYKGKSDIVIDGPFIVEDNSYYYRFAAAASKNHMPEYNERTPTMVLYKFHLPESNTRKYGWKDVFRTVSVSVTDFNGNEGKLQLIFNNGDNFDTPGIV